MDTAPTITRESTRQRLATARATLAAILAATSEDGLRGRQATPEWTALDLLRHIWVWNELSARCLDDWHGSRDWIITFYDEDEFNLEMVAARAGAPLAQIVGGLEQAYGAYEHVLAACSDAELAEPDAAPWGEQLTRTELIWAELGHDLMHMEQARASLA